VSPSTSVQSIHLNVYAVVSAVPEEGLHEHVPRLGGELVLKVMDAEPEPSLVCVAVTLKVYCVAIPSALGLMTSEGDVEGERRLEVLVRSKLELTHVQANETWSFP